MHIRIQFVVVKHIFGPPAESYNKPDVIVSEQKIDTDEENVVFKVIYKVF